MHRHRLVQVLSVVLFAACSSKPPVTIERVSDDFEVQVSAAGREVKDFQQPLVHRMTLSQDRVRFLHVDVIQRRALPFNAKVELDRRGVVSGVKIFPPKSLVAGELGIESLDLITAVNTKPVRALGDMQLLFKTLDEEKSATMTVIRRGQPHKLLYSVIE